jgi:NDP-sugar pyrophosphorylase family protein
VLHPAHHRYNYGKIRVNSQGHIAQFVNQQASGISGPLIDTVFTGVQVLDSAVLDTIPATRVAALTTDVYPGLLTNASRFYGYLMHGYWSDIGTPRRYWETNMDVVGGRVGAAVHLSPDEDDPGMVSELTASKGATIRPPVAIAPGIEVPTGCSIGPEVIIGAGCKLSDDIHLRQSVLWSRVRVGRGAMIEGSIVMNDVTIPDGLHLVGKIVAANGIIDL